MKSLGHSEHGQHPLWLPCLSHSRSLPRLPFPQLLAADANHASHTSILFNSATPLPHVHSGL